MGMAVSDNEWEPPFQNSPFAGRVSLSIGATAPGGIDQMSGEDIVTVICERVVEALKKHETMMGLDHKTLWDDYRDHVINGWSLVESMLMDYIESLIRLELEKLPRSVQQALWWQTDKGNDAMFDAEWGYEHEEPFEPYLGVPAEDDMYQALTDLVLQALSSKAEREALAAEAAFEEDDEDDTEETDE
jgi:hypothetical protein